MYVYELHYKVDGVKRWDMIHAINETDAILSLEEKIGHDNVKIDAAFEYRLKSFVFYEEW